MKTIKALYGQTLADIAIQELGDVGRAFELAKLNGLSITVDLVAGGSILVPAYDRNRRHLVQLFSNVANAPANGDNTDAGVLNDIGIGFWSMEVDFVVQ